jgi:hypothetical protein
MVALTISKSLVMAKVIALSSPSVLRYYYRLSSPSNIIIIIIIYLTSSFSEKGYLLVAFYQNSANVLFKAIPILVLNVYVIFASLVAQQEEC